MFLKCATTLRNVMLYMRSIWQPYMRALGVRGSFDLDFARICGGIPHVLLDRRHHFVALTIEPSADS